MEHTSDAPFRERLNRLQNFGLNAKTCALYFCALPALLLNVSLAHGQTTSGTSAALTGDSCQGRPGLAAVAKMSNKERSCSAVRISCGVFLTAHHCKDADGAFSAFDGTFIGTSSEWISIDNAFPNSSVWNLEYVTDLRDIALVFVYEARCNKPTVRLPNMGEQLDLSNTTLVGFGEEWNGNLCGPQGCNYLHSPATDNGVWLRSDISTSSGDSGGPMLVGDLTSPNARPTVVGVLSSGTGGCTKENTNNHNGSGYGVYTSLLYGPNANGVSPLDFINAEIAKRDSDGDGIVEPMDNCSGLKNPEQADSDDDGKGDDCDDTPCGEKDEDGDKILTDCRESYSDFCKAKCPAELVDNCPQNPNVDQANCNLDAEIATKAVRMGDACDSVPCAAGKAQYETVDTGFATTFMQVHNTKVTLSVKDNLVVKKITSDKINKSATNLFQFVNGATYRYCDPRFSKTAGINCKHPLGISDKYGPSVVDSWQYENPQDYWHQVKIEGIGGIGQADLGWDARSYGGAYGDQLSYTRTWSWKDDFSRWLPKYPGLADDDGNHDLSNLVPNSGRFWFHVDTLVGMSKDLDFILNGNIGVHYNLDGSVGQSLANHYEDITTGYEITSSSSKVPVPEWPWQKWQDCWACGNNASDFGMSRINPPWERLSGEALMFSPIDPSTPDRFGFLLPSGDFREISSSLDAGLLASLRDSSLQWLSPAEANSLQGLGNAYPMSVALNASGNEIVQSVWARNGLPVAGGDPAPLLREASVPSPRLDSKGVYARSIGRVFVVGGAVQRRSGTVYSQDIWMRSLDNQNWTKLQNSFKPEKVLAATWSFADNRLWIVDVLRDGRVGRLTRLNPQTRDVETITTWNVDGTNDRMWLSTDTNGSVALVSSSSRQNTFSVAQFSESSTELVATQTFTGSLLAPPVLDLSGLRLVRSGAELGRADRTALPQTLNLTELRRAAPRALRVTITSLETMVK